ncbi:MAG TPA: Ig-like domain-containing protein [Allosphingosinicella sp.]
MASLPPEVDLNGAEGGHDSSVGYAEGDPVTPLAPEATVSDPDSADFDGGSLTVAFTSGGTADDQLRIAGGGFFVEEADLYYQDVAIGTITGGADGSTPLVVTFNAGVDAAVAAALIRAIGYVTFSGAPIPGERQITFTLADGDGGTSIARVARVSVTSVETPPLAQDDMIATAEDMIATGSLFGDNGGGADSDPDGPALKVAEVNGSADNVDATFVLDSGARLTVNADGSYTYDPNGQFDSLADSSTGAANSSVVDTFTYRLAGGNVAMVTVTVNGVASPGDRLMGDEGDNFITGTPGPDIFVLDQGGADVVSGQGGADIFYFGGALDADDNVDGGGGHDTLVLQGDYSEGLVLDGRVTGIEAVSILAGSNRAFGGSETELHDYAISIQDSAFAAGLRVRINGSALLAGEDLSFDGSAETDATFLIYGGAGTDRLTGGQGNDIFFFDSGRFAAGDTVAGGQGYDGLFLRGNYALDFGARGFADLITDIENLTLTSATDQRYARGGGTEFDYSLFLADSNVGAGRALTVSGALLTGAETMVLDGSRETDGHLRLFGGAADDTLIGGANADLIHGNLGGDEISGGGGADLFRYQATAESVDGSADHINDFTPGTDRIELERIDADTLTAGDQAFSWIGSEAFSGTAGELRAYESGRVWIVEGDVDGDGEADLVIALTLQGQAPLGAGDFIL